MSGLEGVVRLGFEAGQLKRTRRSGWRRAGIRDPESVAEHSWRTALLAWVIAAAEGADPERAATIGVFHDLAETRLSDIDYVRRRYLSAATAKAVIRDQVRDLPAVMAEGILSVVTEMEAQATPESACARDADKLEYLIQAREYEASANVTEWVTSMAEAVTTETGKVLAALALEADPAEWWREVASLHQP